MSSRILALLLGCSLLTVIAAPACGGSSSDHPSPNSAGNAGAAAQAGSSRAGSESAGSSGNSATAGAAGSVDPMPAPCGNTMCSGVTIPIQSFVIPGCCADEATSHCGLDSTVLPTIGPTFAEACQPLAQPGTLDAACPVSPKVPVQGTGLDIQFPGCCRPDHTCGFQLDKLAGVFTIGLGCVDSTPFLDGGTPQGCGDEGAAGAGGDSSSAGAAGDSSTGGDGASTGAGTGGTAGGGGTSGGGMGGAGMGGAGGTSGGGVGGTGG